MITGYLKSDSPLRAIFPTGVPLLTPGSCRAHLGEKEKLTQEIYMISLRRCTKEQREAMARRMAELGHGPYEDALKEVESKDALPIRADHLSGVGMPMSAFI